VIEGEEFIDAGDHVVVSARTVGRVRHTGAEIELQLVELFSFEDGKLARRRVYRDRASALDGVGVQNTPARGSGSEGDRETDGGVAR
jgi:ketosteroid isomerase-like protein